MDSLSAALSLLCVLCLASPLIHASIDVDPYDELLLQSLYKRLSKMDSDYFLSDLSEGARDELPGVAAIRDPEYIEHSSQAANEGFLQIPEETNTGSVDKGKTEGQFAAKAKSDLPFYCHPPNPCPKGMSSADGCQEGIEDTMKAQKEWITRMQEKGYCTCDREHMFDCPASPSEDHSSTINDVVDKILSDQAAATYMSGEKRQTLVAKKSPRVRRALKHNAMDSELKKVDHISHKQVNPYLSGERLRTVAKKG